MLVMTISLQSTSAAAQAQGSGCTVSFNGQLASLQLSPEGGWGLTSSYCKVTDQSNGITSGTFTGNFTSQVYSGIVSGTWSIAGSTQKVEASSTGFTLSVSVDEGMGQAPLLGSAYQGMLSGSTGQAMLTVAAVGHITFN